MRQIHLFRFIVCFVSVFVCGLLFAGQINKSPNDKRQYQSHVLDNGLKVITVSDQQAHIVGTSLLVKAGSVNDPAKWMGLAHYLEHMLFLGTEKYPNLDDFQAYLTANGGSRNAMTTHEYTQYFFSVSPDGFKGAMDRFAQFFIAPLFDKTRTEKEIQAIEAEYRMNIEQDVRHWQDVDKLTSNPAHPYHRFSAGNAKSLSGPDDQRDAALKAFYAAHYVPENMVLAVVGPQSNAQLLQIVQGTFGKVPTKSLSQGDAPPQMYDEAHRGLDIRIKTKGELRELILHFPIDSMQKYYHQKPGTLIALLVGDESEGSLLSALKKQNWVNYLSTDYARIDDEQDRFSISIGLTPTGLNNINEITRAVFSYLSFIETNGYPEYYFEEYKKLNHLSFLYQDYQQPLEHATYLAASARLYPINEVLTHGYIAQDLTFPVELMKQIYQQLSPNNLRRFVLSPEENVSETSEWYQAKYSVEKLSTNELKQSPKDKWQARFALPPPNPFIPGELKLKDNIKKSDVPQAFSATGLNLWYHPETRFGAPKADVLVNFASPHAFDSPTHAVSATLYAQLVGRNLQEKMYPASLTGAMIGLSSHARGLTLTVVNGYSAKQDLILSAVIDEMLSFKIDPKHFYNEKDKLVRLLKNYQQSKLFSKAFTDLRTIIEEPNWHPEKLLASVQEVTPETVEQFKQEFFKNCGLEILINGNYTASESKALATKVRAKHDFVSADNVQPLRVAKLAGRYIWKIKHKDKDDVWLSYYQCVLEEPSNVAKVALLGNILQSPYFETLRSNKQLAYALGIMPLAQHDVAGLAFWLQSPNTSPDGIHGHVSEFVKQSLQDDALWQPEFLKQVQANLARQWRQPPKTLNEQSMRWWAQIEKGYHDFNRNLTLADSVENISAKELKDFYANLMQPENGNLVVVSKLDKNYFKDFNPLSNIDELTQKGVFF